MESYQTAHPPSAGKRWVCCFRGGLSGHRRPSVRSPLPFRFTAIDDDWIFGGVSGGPRSSHAEISNARHSVLCGCIAAVELKVNGVVLSRSMQGLHQRACVCLSIVGPASLYAALIPGFPPAERGGF